jgi:hypothetical protein
MHPNSVIVLILGGPSSIVGIVTGYGLDGPGSNPGEDEIFPLIQTGPGAHPASCTMGTGSFLAVKCDRGGAYPSPPSSAAPFFWCRGLGRVELCLNPPGGHNQVCNGVTLPFTFYSYYAVMAR